MNANEHRISTDIYKLAVMNRRLSFVLFFLQSPCWSSPCQNGGTCLPSYRHDIFECLCKSNFAGEYCEKGIGELSTLDLFNPAFIQLSGLSKFCFS